MAVLGILTALTILLFSVILHELAHGWVALKFGDDTAEYSGRLTLDPRPHLDLFGSIILPLLLYLSGGPIFAWAKPVPVDFERLNRWQSICVSLAGVAVNLLVAALLGLLLRLVFLPAAFPVFLISFVILVVKINILLGAFNLVPIPPLDGWRLWGVWLPDDLRIAIEVNALWLMLALFLFLPYLSPFIWRATNLLFTLITGIR